MAPTIRKFRKHKTEKKRKRLIPGAARAIKNKGRSGCRHSTRSLREVSPTKRRKRRKRERERESERESERERERARERERDVGILTFFGEMYLPAPRGSSKVARGDKPSLRIN